MKKDKNQEKEVRIRDAYALRLHEYRPNEKLIDTEITDKKFKLRTDMRTVDKFNVLREWEFKIKADYSALGQVLVYAANLRKKHSFRKIIKPVIAAVEIPVEIRNAILYNCLDIELVKIPIEVHNAGKKILNRRKRNPLNKIKIPKEKS